VTTITAQNRNTSNIAMTVTLVSLAMLFASLFLMYAVFRVQNKVWPPMGFEEVPLLVPLVSTLIILVSSYFYHLTQKAFSTDNRKAFKSNLYLTLLTGFMFLGSQLYLWSYLKTQGFYVSAGVFPSILHGFTWIHAAHVVMGILALLYLLPVAYRKEWLASDSLRVLNIGKFWHFLDIVWLVMFIALFVI
jgi:heme/copper-type cytochrome/quinol oxidase subunit 3